MTSAGPAFQEFTTIFVLGLAMLMLHLCRQDHHYLQFDRWSDCIGPDGDSLHFGTLSYHTSNTMKPTAAR
jgi:hypothetical protein